MSSIVICLIYLVVIVVICLVAAKFMDCLYGEAIGCGILIWVCLVAYLVYAPNVRDASAKASLEECVEEEISVEETNIVSISASATNSEKYELYKKYDSSLSYTIPSDLDKKHTGWAKEYKKYLKEKYSDSNEYMEKWNYYLWSEFFKPDYSYILKKDYPDRYEKMKEAEKEQKEAEKKASTDNNYDSNYNYDAGTDMWNTVIMPSLYYDSGMW